MKVDRDVVIDLLPVYFSDEASAATRKLVEECFREDPELELAARSANKSVETLKNVAVPQDQWKEMLALERMREKTEALYATWVVAFTFLLATMFQIRDHKPVFVLWKLPPLVGLICAAATGILGVVFFRLRARSASVANYFHFWTAALFFTLALSFMIHIEDHKIIWFFFSDQPIAGAIVAVLAACLWIAYFIERRRVRRKNL
jgi:hypothetical protein